MPKPFYGRLFFSPSDGGGGAGGGTASGDGAGNEPSGDANADADTSASADQSGGADRKAGGSGDGTPTQGDIDRLTTALNAERRQTATVQKFAKDRGITVAKAIELFQQTEDANKTELERATTERDRERERADTNAQKLRTANARSAVTVAATTANAVDADAVYALIRDDLEYDDGEPTNVDSVFSALKKSKPHLFRAAPGRTDANQRDADTIELTPGVSRMAHAYATESKTARKR